MAITILGIAIAALVELYAVTLRSTKKSVDYSEAVIYGRSYLDEAYSLPAIKPVSESFDMGHGFRVERTVSLLSEEEGVKTYEITVTVTWPTSGRFRLTGIRIAHETEGS